MRHLILFSILFSFTLSAHASNKQKEAEPIELAEILAGYFEAQGGLEYIEGINGLRLSGSIRSEDTTLPFVQIKKRPNKLRFTITYPNTSSSNAPGVEIIMGYNGDVAWQTIRQREQAVELTGRERSNFIREAALFSHLYQPTNKNVLISYLGEGEVDGQAVYRLKVTLEDGHTLIYSVDQERFLDLQIETSFEHEGDTISNVSKFQDFRKVGQLEIPFHITSIENGQEQYVITLDNVDVNPGIYNDYFDPPGGLEGKDPLPGAAASKQ